MEDKTALRKIVSGKLDSDEFWNLDAFAEHGETLRTIHNVIVSRLVEESPDADMLELMLMERSCFLYVFMRAKEANLAEFSFDRAYSEMLRMWTSMAADLRKQRLRAEEVASIRAAVVKEISRAITDVLAETEVEPEVANKMKAQLVHLVAV